MSSSSDNPAAANQLTVLCLASYFKGLDFIRECRRQGCRVLLLTSHSLADEPWPRESIDEMFYIPDVQKKWKMDDVLLGVSYMGRKEKIDRIVPLDDFDVETAATLREHLRVPGMGDTTARYFRDKLAMRTKARDEGLAVPDFIHILNYAQLHEFMDHVPPPWVLKPRSMAGSMGVKKIASADELWATLDKLGDQQSYYLSSNTSPATSTMWTRSSTSANCCSPSPAVTGVRRWTSRTRAISSPPVPCRAARRKKLRWWPSTSRC